MATRLWTALLMLAAVFAMHGLQCASAADGTHTSDAVHAPSYAVHAPSDAPTAPASEGAHLAGGPAAADLAVAVVDDAHGSTPHESAGHLWTLCLAVLAAGIAALLTVLAPRLIGLAWPALRRVRGRAYRWLTPLRPPDLSALCLLRI
jgi:hypothetical protein